MYIFLKCPECIFPKGPKALKEIYSVKGLKENIVFAPNLKKDKEYSWKNSHYFLKVSILQPVLIDSQGQRLLPVKTPNTQFGNKNIYFLLTLLVGDKIYTFEWQFLVGVRIYSGVFAWRLLSESIRAFIFWFAFANQKINSMCLAQLYIQQALISTTYTIDSLSTKRYLQRKLKPNVT